MWTFFKLQMPIFTPLPFISVLLLAAFLWSVISLAHLSRATSIACVCNHLIQSELQNANRLNVLHNDQPGERDTRRSIVLCLLTQCIICRASTVAFPVAQWGGERRDAEPNTTRLYSYEWHTLAYRKKAFVLASEMWWKENTDFLQFYISRYTFYDKSCFYYSFIIFLK